MKDKGLNIFLSVLFGISGIAILLLAWTEPASLLERILTTAIGSVGLIWAFSRALPLVFTIRRFSHQSHQQDVEN